jgi:hypothetical protein
MNHRFMSPGLARQLVKRGQAILTLLWVEGMQATYSSA